MSYYFIRFWLSWNLKEKWIMLCSTWICRRLLKQKIAWNWWTWWKSIHSQQIVAFLNQIYRFIAFPCRICRWSWFMLTKPDRNVSELITEVMKYFEKVNLILKEEKTKRTKKPDQNHPVCTKRLVSILEDHADLKRRSQLSLIALRMCNLIWENRFINVSKKLKYRILFRPILTYNWSTWHSNRGFKSTFDVCHQNISGGS